MLFVKQNVNTEEVNKVNEFLNQYENIFETPVVEEEQNNQAVISQYLTSLVSSQYQKSVEDIENTTIGNSLKRKRSLQQIMKESFFYGANRFGNNFIA